MVVKVLDREGEWVTMAYDPCHYDGIVSFYTEQVDTGRILGFTVER